MQKRCFRLFAFCVCLLICLQLSGCTSFVGVENMLAPPQLEGDKQEIYNALSKSVTGSMELVYPQKGDYKSAITQINIDQEPTDEAVAFYRIDSAASSTTVTLPIRINILDQRDGKWVSVYEMGVDADEVEKVELLHAGEEIYLAVGYNYVGSSEKKVQIYRFADYILSVVHEFRALNYEICDLDEDGNSEIVKLVSAAGTKTEDSASASSQVSAQLVQAVGNSFLSANSVSMSPLASEYSAINIGELSDGKPAIYLDGISGSQFISEILFCDENGMLKNLIYFDPEQREAENRVLETQRQSGIYSQDIDRDQVYEIPLLVIAPGYEQKERYEQLYFTSWYKYSSTGRRSGCLTYTDYTLGYAFKLPSRWEGVVTAEVSSADNEITFYEYDRKTGERGVPVLSVRVMSRSDYQPQGLHSKYSVIEVSGKLVFLYYSHNRISDLALSESTIQKSLYLLN